jgi:outer membrane protein assembly factor BamB
MAEYKVEEKELFDTPAGSAVPEEGIEMRQMIEAQADQMGGSIGLGITVAEGAVYFGSGDKNVYCLRESTGELIWKFNTGALTISSPEYVGGILYVSSLDGHVFALNAQTGEMIWKTRLSTDRLLASPSVAHGVLYIGSFDSYLYALSARDGSLLWKFKSGGLIWSTSAVLNGKVFFGSADKRVYCIDAKTGNLIWKYLSNGWISTLLIGNTGGESVWYYSNRENNGKNVPNLVVCADSWSKEIFLVDENGNKIWQKPTEATVGTPAVHGKKVYAGGRNNYLYCFDFEDGRMLWKFQTGGILVTEPWIEGREVFFGSLDGYCYSLNPEDGTLLWKFKTGGPIITSPVVSNGTLYLGSWDCYVYAIDVATKEVKWKFRTGEAEGKAVFIKHLGMMERIRQRLRSFFRPEAKSAAYEKAADERQKTFFKYGVKEQQYEFKSDVVYFTGQKDYNVKRDVDKEWREKFGRR